MERRRYGALLLGVCAGFGVAANWRPLVKQAVKQGIFESARLTRSTLRFAEDLSDVIQEARFEAAHNASADHTADTAFPGPGSDAGAGGRLMSVDSEDR